MFFGVPYTHLGERAFRGDARIPVKKARQSQDCRDQVSEVFLSAATTASYRLESKVTRPTRTTAVVGNDSVMVFDSLSAMLEDLASHTIPPSGRIDQHGLRNDRE
jgi:hypothetical protein